MPIYMQKKRINRLKAILAEKGKTNKWLAKELGINETTVSRWCTNETQPRLNRLVKISELLNVDIGEMFLKEST